MLTGRVARLERATADRVRAARTRDESASAFDRYAPYRADPVGFARDVLGVRLTGDQGGILRALHEPPFRSFAKSGHSVGKTLAGAVALAHWFYTRPRSVVISTAPTERDVIDLLWTEVRLLVRRAGLPAYFVGPSAPEMFDTEEHWAKGYTARKGESFQGRHREGMLFLFDEAEGVDATYWKTTNTMFKGDDGHGWLVTLNPTTTTSQSYQEEQAVGPDGSPKWKVTEVSSLDHPNVAVGLGNRERAGRGESPLPLPVPNAVSLEQAEGWIAEWFEPVAADEVDPESDVEFPPGSGRWHRPGPDGEGRVLGRRPSAGTFGVWSEAAWKAAAADRDPAPEADALPELGHDSARFGDDRTETHVRCGSVSLHHEDHGGWDTVRQADRLMRLADEWAAWATARRPTGTAPVDPKAVRVKVDDTGVGGGVTDVLRANGYAAVPVNAGGSAPAADKYPRVRDELWFAVRARAKAGRLRLGRLPAARLAKLKVQALAPTWTPTADRRRQVEPKEKTKARIGRSPDGMDALNLAYYEPGGPGVAEWVGGTGGHRSWRDRVSR